MDNKKKIKLSALATGSLVLGAITVGNVNAADQPVFEDLGTGAELRSELLATTNPIAFMDNRDIELKCGEGTCGEKSEEGKKAEASDDKAGEHKCGEGKCGEEKGEEKTEQKAEKKEKKAEKEAKAAEDKAGEHKCGEGKCGN